jgi:hypothetical protein
MNYVQSLKEDQVQNAFIFSLTNKDTLPLKMKINPKRLRYAIYFQLGHTYNIAENEVYEKRIKTYLLFCIFIVHSNIFHQTF